VWAVEVGRDANLSQEPTGPEHGPELRLEKLQRNVAVMPEIAGERPRGSMTYAEQALTTASSLSAVPYLRTYRGRLVSELAEDSSTELAKH
jgi:hypothetical protein